MTKNNIIQSAIQTLDEYGSKKTRGKWLEELFVEVAPYINEWDIAKAWMWHEDWPGRDKCKFSNQDVGIDAVAQRRSDEKLISIQCKARKLKEEGKRNAIAKKETDKFSAAASNQMWAERWIVTNGDNPLTANTQERIKMQGIDIKVINIHADLHQAKSVITDSNDCPHCRSGADAETAIQNKTCMQREAITESIRILKKHEKQDSGGFPKGQARGKIILPCGTGKTRVSLRIIEKLTGYGELSVVLCPSIALVAQIRREYLDHKKKEIRSLAVCSDETAAYDPKREDSINILDDPTADNSHISALEVKGEVTTNPEKISNWIEEGTATDKINVIFGTYQSGHAIAKAMKLLNTPDLPQSQMKIKVLIADEAHRTAGLRRIKSKEKQLREFTLCHDNDKFPATYRIYQTATPKVFGAKHNKSNDWIVRTMDDESVFGVELYRKSYPEAVRNGWLSDYRIIALGINDVEAYEQAKLLASETELKGKTAPTSTQYLRGLAFALAMGGATQSGKNNKVRINSCIGFMNSVAKSKEMARTLQTEPVRQWVQEWLYNNAGGGIVKPYRLEHLDATNNIISRNTAKQKLTDATPDKPYGILNVGIFGEGTDSPSLSAVAFLEARKSPIDVIQSVGRAMRISSNKEFGYIICPVLIPPDADPESHLSSSKMEEGWKELGQILLALRAHDQRIEDKLSDLLSIYLPSKPENVRTIIALVNENVGRIQYREHEGSPDAAEDAVEKVLKGKLALNKVFNRINDPQAKYKAESTQIVTGKKNSDGNIEIRKHVVVREKPIRDQIRGVVNYDKSKNKAKKMINNGEGILMEQPSKKRERRKREKIDNEKGNAILRLSRLDEHGKAIRMNLLAKSGLNNNRILRDLNLLEVAIKEASFHLENECLTTSLNEHFGLTNLEEDATEQKDTIKQADGCTIASLLMMNAAMLHQRISIGGWMSGISQLKEIKNSTHVISKIKEEWERIMRIDFCPIFQPAIDLIYAIEEDGKTAGLERALHHIAAEAERIAETYADMGADHAGPLFNKVMGNQASDGAFFTRPAAASLAARLTLDACGEQNWADTAAWHEHKMIDLACGSGTLLAAMLADMKRRARAYGANDNRIAELQKLAVEDVIKGMDINPVSLQLAAAQLTAGNKDVRYRRMGLHLMPYGPDLHDPQKVAAGTLELLGQKAIIHRDDELDMNSPDDAIDSQEVWEQENIELEDAVDAAKGVRIVIMNPPFTNRTKMGEKFRGATQQALRARTDQLGQRLTRIDADLTKFTDKNSIGPLFVGLAERCMDRSDGVLVMINPTIALTATSGHHERLILARRFHIHTVLTSNQPQNINMSQHTNINESIVVMRRHRGSKPPTRFINLDKMPVDDSEVADFHQCLLDCKQGPIANGWGEVSYWPAKRMETGDWTAAIWRSSELAQAAADFYYNSQDLSAIGDQSGLSPRATGRVLRGSFERTEPGTPGSFPILKSKSADAQQFIRGIPDEHWAPKKKQNGKTLHLNDDGHSPEINKMLQKAGYLLITAGQDNRSGRLTAVADNEKYVGNGWVPVTGLSSQEAKAAAVFINSTIGRLQLMRTPGRKLDFPTYSVKEVNRLRIPNIKNKSIRNRLAACYEQTKDKRVPQFREGECEVRRLWDEAVAKAMGWDNDNLTRLRQLLHKEPHVCGLGYGQYADDQEE